MQLGSKAKYEKDKRVVLTLDAGGTTLTFSALRGGDEISEAIILPSVVDELDTCLEQIVCGFRQARQQIQEDPPEQLEIRVDVRPNDLGASLARLGHLAHQQLRVPGGPGFVE